MIYFRGCVAREKLQNIGKATEEILKLAGVDYKILENEKCCGSFLLRTGFIAEAKEVMKNTLKEIGEEKVLVSCAGCYKTFKKDYKELLDVEIDVIHSSKLFNQLINDEKIDLKYMDKKVTYHDPCHLGRQMEEYDAPRMVISKASNLVEMKRSREKSRCCGAGAGVRSAYPRITEEIAKSRLGDAEDVNVEVIITSCPFCILNLNSACLGSKSVFDLAEFVLKSLKNGALDG
jgi:Fe-S oxidoreductase